MRRLNDLNKLEKIEILRDWIDSMDEYGLDELLIEYLEYSDDSESFDEE